MIPVTLRLPEGLINAYDEAEGNRSAVMRDILTRAVVDGEVDTPTQYQKLAKAEKAKQRARWDVLDSGLRGRAYQFVQSRWEDGTHPPESMERAMAGFREEAEASEDPGAVEYIDRLLAWYRDAWPEENPEDRPQFPDAAGFHSGVPAVAPVKRSGSSAPSPTVEKARQVLEDSKTDQEAFERLAEDMGKPGARSAIAIAKTQ